jgi:Antitoxin MazE-like
VRHLCYVTHPVRAKDDPMIAPLGDLTTHMQRLWNSPMATSIRPSRGKVRAHRERLRRQGLRPIQIWVPDVRSPAFKAEAQRQSLTVAQSRHEDEDQALVDTD